MRVSAALLRSSGAAWGAHNFSDDRTRVAYEYTIEDPLSLTEPVTRSAQWTYRPDVEPSGEQCDRDLAMRFLRESAE